MSTSPDAGDQAPLPPVSPAFHWTTESWGNALRCRPLDTIAPHLFTTRQLQLVEPRDVTRLAAALGARDVVMVTQVHKAGVLIVRQSDPPLQSRPEADVIVSNDPSTAIAVRAADCVPLLIGDRVTGAVAAVHAGWRGTVAGAARIAVEVLGREFGARAEDLTAAIGPSIGSCCYEVGTELVDAFGAEGFDRYLIDRWFLSPPPRRGSRARQPLRLDLPGANRDQLILAGVPEESVYLSEVCTAMNLDVFCSYRAEQHQAGRIAGAIVARAL
jgi:YfiH family protein